MNNIINSYKKNFNNIQNNSSKSTLIDYLPTEELKKVQKIGKTIQNSVTNTAVSTSLTLHGIVNSKLGGIIINLCIVSILMLTIGILFVFYKKIKDSLKEALKYLIITLVSLLISMYGIYIVFPKKSMLAQVISISLIGVVAFGFIKFMENILNYIESIRIDSPWIIKGTKNGKQSMTIPQDPKNQDSVTLYRSENQSSGIEFSYSFWMNVQDYKYNPNGKNKHVFHKGGQQKSNKDYTIFCPKVVLKNESNTLSINMNLIDGTNSDDIDIENIPLNKWMHVAIVLKQRKCEVYINGKLKKYVELKTIPRQNFGDLWVNLNGGFDGFLSKFQYHRRALEFTEVESIVIKGPSTDACSFTGDIPPYFDENWWLDK
jgi:hypothetical protein